MNANRPFWSTTLRGAAVALTLAVLAAGCSSRDRNATEGAGEKQAARVYPPGSAAALSLSSGPSVDIDDPYDKAVECAANIGITIEALRGRTSMLPKDAVDGLRQAHEIYRREAASLAPEELTEAQVRARIDELTQLGQGAAATKVQTAIACVRELA